jgi:hypothetical protein
VEIGQPYPLSFPQLFYLVSCKLKSSDLSGDATPLVWVSFLDRFVQTVLKQVKREEKMREKFIRFALFFGSILVIWLMLSSNNGWQAWAKENDPTMTFETIADSAGESGVTKLVPTVGQILVSNPSPPLIGVDGDRSRIAVQVVGTNDEPVDNGVVVSFEAKIGSFDPVDAMTSGGAVETTYISEATITGTVTITVSAGGKKATTQIEISDQVSSMDVLALHASAFPPIIGINNEKSEVTVVVTATNGFPVANGASVQFDTTLGIISPTVISTVNGIAAAVLTSGPVTGTAVISVTAGGEGIKTTTAVEFSNKVSSLDVASIVARANPPNIDVGGKTSIVTAMITATNGFRIADGVIVTFEPTFGLISPTTKATLNGVAETLFISGNMTGTAIIAVKAGEETVETSVEVGIMDKTFLYLPMIVRLR